MHVFHRKDVNFEGLTDEETLRGMFRKQSILLIVGILTGFLQFTTRRNQALTPLLQVPVLFNGRMLTLTGDNFGLSVVTVGRCVTRVATALSRVAHIYTGFSTTDRSFKNKV